MKDILNQCFLKNNQFDIVWDNVVITPAIGELKKIIYEAKVLVPQLKVFPMSEDEKSLYIQDLTNWFEKESSYAHIALKTVIGRRR